MIQAADIVAEARTYLGTPFHHCGRSKGRGVDCIGLVAGVAQHFALTYHDLPAYPRRPDGVTLVREFSQCLLPVPLGEARVGDVGVFWFLTRGMACHAGILTDHGLLHTYAVVGKVVEHTINAHWRRRLMTVFRYPGVEPGGLVPGLE